MNDEFIWNFLLSKTKNAYGTAAIMGNLMAESSLNARNVTGLKKTGYQSADQYILASDDEVHDFAHDGVAFGLAQWCYHTRKGGLQAYAKQTGRSVGDLQMQLEYLVKEMSQDYKSVWKAVTEAKDIRTASDTVMLKYEKPATTSEAAKKKRADYGKLLYVEYGMPDQEPSPAPKPSGKKMVRAKRQVNIRSGPGKKNPKIGELKSCDTVELIGEENGFYKVAAYVMKDFSEVIG